MQGIDLPIPSPLAEQAARWPSLKRWERRELGRALRRLGLSYREIGMIIPVSRSTLSGWCRDVRLDERASTRLASSSPHEAARLKGYERRKARTRAGHEAVRAAARAEAAGLASDPYWVAGVVAYWAEGSKRTPNDVRFTNSDPAMVRLFLNWSRRYLGLSIEQFDINLHLHTGQEERERIAYWSGVTGIPLDQFRKTYVKPEGTGHRKHLLYNGTASVRVRSGSAHYDRVMGWIDALATWAASSTG